MTTGTDESVGHFAWDITQDIVWGDAGLASILGLSPDACKAGFPIKTFLGMVHIDDIERVALQTRLAVVSGEPYDLVYRIIRSDTVVPIRGRGSCYRWRDGIATLSSGFLQEMVANAL